MKKLVVLLAVAGLFVSVAGASAGVEKVVEEPKRGETVCTGEVVVQRPMWQRIVAFGLLGSEDASAAVVNIPGAVTIEAVRAFKSRNVDIEAVFGTLIPRLKPDLLRESFVCSFGTGLPVKLDYNKGDGKTPAKFSIVGLEP